MNESTDLINGKIWKAILWFSIPMLVGNLFQQLYNTVDSYVVGNFVSSGALAAVGQSTPIINTLVGFFTGLATGAGVVIAQYFGGNHLNKMKKSNSYFNCLNSYFMCIIHYSRYRIIKTDFNSYWFS